MLKYTFIINFVDSIVLMEVNCKQVHLFFSFPINYYFVHYLRKSSIWICFTKKKRIVSSLTHTFSICKCTFNLNVTDISHKKKRKTWKYRHGNILWWSWRWRLRCIFVNHKVDTDSNTISFILFLFSFPFKRRSWETKLFWLQIFCHHTICVYYSTVTLKMNWELWFFVWKFFVFVESFKFSLLIATTFLFYRILFWFSTIAWFQYKVNEWKYWTNFGLL